MQNRSNKLILIIQVLLLLCTPAIASLTISWWPEEGDTVSAIPIQQTITEVTTWANGLSGSDLADSSITSAQLAPGSVTQDILADSITFLSVGMIVPFGGDTEPLGWLFCDGSEVSRITYANLYAVTGDLFGAGDGMTTFNLPDFRGRVVVGYNLNTISAVATEDTRSANNIGDTGGAEVHTLSIPEIPYHDHGFDGSSDFGHASASFGAGGLEALQYDTGFMPQGGNRPHTIMQPYLVTQMMIYTGVR